MQSKMSRKQIERQFAKLTSIKEIPLQIEELRKLLSHFINLLQADSMYEEYYCEALNICEILIAKCEVVERDINVLFKIINTILEIVKRDYVSKRVVIDSLAAIHQIMHHLYHMEVIHLHEILREKLPYVSKYFNEMEHYSIMWSIVGIVYEYVGKYNYDERESVLTDVLRDFHDSTEQLADMILWPPESFNSKCQQFLNNIVGRKYYSLSAHSATFGGRLILPSMGYDYIAFNWNTNPFELSCSTFCFATEMNKASEFNVDLKDINTLIMIEDEHEPRVICEYEKIKSDVESYELKIGVKDNTELNELATFISPLIKSVQYIQLSKPTASENESQENIIRYEKLYDNTAELIEELNANKQPTKPEETHSMAVHEMPAEETIDEDADATFKPFDMQWKSNLVDKSMKKPCLPKDPYDIAHMRAEEKEQQKEKVRFRGMAKSESQWKSVNAVQKGNRPKSMQSSTPKKSRCTKVTDSLTIDKDDLSSIGENSNDELMDSEGSDATYVPYSMLSKTSNRGRGNQKGRKRQSDLSARAPAKRTNLKKNESAKNATGQRTGTKGGKEQSWAGWTGTRTTESSMQKEKKRPCYAPDTTLPKPETRGQTNQQGVKFRCERLNSINTTTKMTTKVTTTKTTEVGIGSRTETDNRPTAAPVTLENANRTPTLETMPCPATQKVYTSLYTVEKHQEYSIHCAVNETSCLRNAITEGERSLILEHVNKIIDILSHGINTTGMS